MTDSFFIIQEIAGLPVRNDDRAHGCCTPLRQGSVLRIKILIVAAILFRGEKFGTIQLYRELPPCGLKEAVEMMARNTHPPGTRTTAASQDRAYVIACA